MAVVVKLPTVLRPFAGGVERVEVTSAEAETTVGAVFAALEQEHPALRRRLTDEQGALRRHVNVFLGNDNVRDLDGLGTTLTDGDELLILPSVAGG
ncbi:ubiquitin-like small modifier protein 1 [Kribbella sp. VKM Ac-2568]|uniref:ubiquitin-like small modifier protein 1 n=1 Tax=Kribbella sp. VKM Ac-2568 TaxID=2512219 RepID=UPI00104B2787|nr:ubiquitin-like small modifier protein 1 [Kribbella sp. VKM Ac-2568]TCM41012.1 molybdopterin converting factor small subunit [Kribbella sp. VKM Ac-2568]